MIWYFSLPRILLKHIRPSKIPQLILCRTRFSLNFSEVWQPFYLWLITFPRTHSTMFTHFGQNTAHNSIHYQSKKFLKCLKICTMVKGSVVQIVTHPFVPLTLIYTLGVLQRLLGIFWWLSKGTGKKCPCSKTDPPCLPGHLFLSTPADPRWALLTSTRHTHLAYPHCVFLLSESLLMTSSLWGLNWISRLICKRPVLKLTLRSVFPGLNSP